MSNKKEPDPIGVRVRELREAKNLTQDQLGEDFKISGKSVSHWEIQGIKRKKLLEEVAKYFNVTVDWLKTGKEKSSLTGNTLTNKGISGGSKASNEVSYNRQGSDQSKLTDEERIELATLRVKVEGLEKERDLYKELYQNAKQKK